jgi:hypothetical protein
MTFDERVERALRTDDPVMRLRDIAAEMIEQGLPRADVIARFEAVRQRLREQDREADEDAVMDVMDILDGWCGPHIVIPPGPGERSDDTTPRIATGPRD